MAEGDFWSRLVGQQIELPVSLRAALDAATPTRGVVALLWQAANFGPLKRSDQREISSIFLLAAAVHLGLLARGAEPDSEADMEDLRTMGVLAAGVRAEGPRLGSAFADLINDLLVKPVHLGETAISVVTLNDFHFSNSVARHLQAWQAVHPLSVRRVMIDVLGSSSKLPGRLATVGLTADGLRDLLQGVPSREAAEPLLSVKQSPAIDLNRPERESLKPTPGKSGNLDPVSAESPSSEWSSGGLASREWDAYGALPPNVSRGSHRPDEALGTEDYATALATLLRTWTSEDDELCLGIFGHWGIGKTFLARTIQSLLTDRADTLKENLAKAGIAMGHTSDEAFSRRFESVGFSAWKYRRTPELWVYLYETLCATCMAGIAMRWPRLLRYNVLRQGHWPLVGGLVSAGVALSPVSPKSTLLGLAVLLVPVLGWGGLLWLFRTARSAHSGAETIMRRYATLTRHSEKLGLQALIGEELQRLVIAWAPINRFKWKELWPEALGATTVAALWCLHWADMLPTPLSAVCSALLSEAHCVTPATEAWRLWLSGGLTVLLFGVVIGLLRWHGRPATERILIIVDDLDRCGADEIVEVMESLKLLLEDPDVRRRVHVLMLVDEGAMEHAIAQKFAGLIRTRAHARSAEARDRKATLEAARLEVVREHVEKLFICHLRLPVLSPEEVHRIVGSYAKEFAALPGTTPTASSPINRTNPPAPEEQNDSPVAYGANLNPAIVPVTELSSIGSSGAGAWESDKSPEPGFHPNQQLYFTQAEIDLMSSILAKQAGEAGRLISPRAVLAFMLKYQLARLLRQLAGKDVQPKTLMTALAQACFENAAPSRVDQKRARDDIAVIAAQLG